MGVRKSRILVVGGGTYLGYHVMNQLKDIFDFTATYTSTWDSPKPWTRVAVDMNPQVLKACFSGLLIFGGYDWVILSPEIRSDERAMVANCLVNALQTTLYPGSVVMLSHEGAHEYASSDGTVGRAGYDRDQAHLDDMFEAGVHLEVRVE